MRSKCRHSSASANCRLVPKQPVDLIENHSSAPRLGTLMNLRVYNTRLLSYRCWHGVLVSGSSAGEARRAWGLGCGTSSRSGGSCRKNTSSDIDLVTSRTTAAASAPSRVRVLPTRKSYVGEE